MSDSPEGVRVEDQATDLLERLGHVVAGVGQQHGLTAAQWAALRFFGRANRFSRTVSSFAGFHATTRGTASQTVKRLVDRGLLRKSPSVLDGRSHRLDLTAKGRRTLADDPLTDLVTALSSLAPGTRARFVTTLRRVTEHVVRSRGGPTFGTCPECAHLDHRHSAHSRSVGESAGGDASAWCGLLEEPLDIAEFEQLCVNYTARRRATAKGRGRTPS